jgi:hypothetical protein
MAASGYVFLGLVLFLTGLMHRYAGLNTVDKKVFFTLNRFLSSQPLIRLFRTLWPLGTTPAALVLLTLILFLKTTSPSVHHYTGYCSVTASPAN